MSSQHFSTAVIPFPELPPSLAAGLPATGIGMRRFGIDETDLAIDFEDRDTSNLITRILNQCAFDPSCVIPPGFFGKLTVGKRLEFSLALAAGIEGSPFTFPFPCQSCDVELEMELTLTEIAEIQREADSLETIEIDVEGRPVSLRKPLGRDQEEWAGLEFRDEVEAAKAMIGILSGDTELAKDLDRSDVDLIDDLMNSSDPLVNFLCRIGCSECGAENEILIDLCDVALGMLGRLQQQLIVTIHKLASHYHWSEKEIFEIPHWRRLEYLELIADGR